MGFVVTCGVCIPLDYDGGWFRLFHDVGVGNILCYFGVRFFGVASVWGQIFECVFRFGDVVWRVTGFEVVVIFHECFGVFLSCYIFPFLW